MLSLSLSFKITITRRGFSWLEDSQTLPFNVRNMSMTWNFILESLMVMKICNIIVARSPVNQHNTAGDARPGQCWRLVTGEGRRDKRRWEMGDLVCQAPGGGEERTALVSSYQAHTYFKSWVISSFKFVKVRSVVMAWWEWCTKDGPRFYSIFILFNYTSMNDKSDLNMLLFNFSLMANSHC